RRPGTPPPRRQAPPGGTPRRPLLLPQRTQHRRNLTAPQPLAFRHVRGAAAREVAARPMAPGMRGERVKELTDDPAHLLDGAHARFAGEDGVARARLLVALAADVPPALSPKCKSRYERMKRYASRAAIAAALLLTPAVVWYLNAPRTLFAQVA